MHFWNVCILDVRHTQKMVKTQKGKKLFFSAPEHARTVLNAYLECMYFDKLTVKTYSVRTCLLLQSFVAVFLIHSHSKCLTL